MSGFVWIIHRMDKQFEKMQAQMDVRFEKVDNRMNSMENRISNMEHKLTAIDMRTIFIERLLEMVRLPQLPLPQKEITDP
ncbi:MAG: hypothetical protein ACRDDW_03235 [Candidatus Rhabdochlamydia sp.]